MFVWLANDLPEVGRGWKQDMPAPPAAGPASSGWTAGRASPADWRSSARRWPPMPDDEPTVGGAQPRRLESIPPVSGPATPPRRRVPMALAAVVALNLPLG